MTEIIHLSQKFRWVRITPYKDYCNLSERNIYENKSEKLRKINFRQKNSTKKDVCFFYAPDNISKYESIFSDDHSIRLMSYRPIGNKYDHFDTQSEKHIKAHYGRPFSSIDIISIERSVVQKGKKIFIKFKKIIKRRELNDKYFRRYVSSHTIIFDTENGNFKTVEYTRRGKETPTLLRTNVISKLKTNLEEIYIGKRKSFYDDQNRYRSEISTIFNDLEFTEAILKLLSIEIKIIGRVSITEIFKNLVTYFITKKEIKVPNSNYLYLLSNFYPTEKFLKKNDRKLIASILDMFNIKSKQTIKLLHNYPNMDIVCFVKLCKFFGKDYNKFISQIKDVVFLTSNVGTIKDNTCGEIGENNKHFIFNTRFDPLETEDEKKFVIKILNADDKIFSTKVICNQFINELYDHFNMYKKIKEYDPNFKLRAKTFEEFKREHRELSKLCAAIKKGYVIEYVYSKKTVDEIEYPIINDGLKLYPYILKREDDYIEEGNFMHHCVATYSDKENSIIISIRTEDQKDRVTLEINKQTGNLLQARHFCNGLPPEIFNMAINVIQDKTKRMARYGTLNWIEKNIVPLKINGVEVKPEGPRRPYEIDLPL